MPLLARKFANVICHNFSNISTNCCGLSCMFFAFPALGSLFGYVTFAVTRRIYTGNSGSKTEKNWINLIRKAAARITYGFNFDALEVVFGCFVLFSLFLLIPDSCFNRIDWVQMHFAMFLLLLVQMLLIKRDFCKERNPMRIFLRAILCGQFNI